MDSLYLRERCADQAFWDYARVRDDVPFELRFLLDHDRVLVGAESARRVLAYFHGLGFSDDETPNLRTPVELVNYDGRPVLVPDAAQLGARLGG